MKNDYSVLLFDDLPPLIPCKYLSSSDIEIR